MYIAKRMRIYVIHLNKRMGRMMFPDSILSMHQGKVRWESVIWYLEVLAAVDTDRLQAAGWCNPLIVHMHCYTEDILQVTLDMFACAAECRGHVAMWRRCGAAAHGLPCPPPRSRLVSAAARQPAVAPQWVPLRHGVSTCPAVGTGYWHA